MIVKILTLLLLGHFLRVFVHECGHLAAGKLGGATKFGWKPPWKAPPLGAVYVYDLPRRRSCSFCSAGFVAQFVVSWLFMISWLFGAFSWVSFGFVVSSSINFLLYERSEEKARRKNLDYHDVLNIRKYCENGSDLLKLFRTISWVDLGICAIALLLRFVR